MRSRRPRTALTLVVLGCLLLASIAIGQRIGDRALFGATERRNPVAAPLATPVPETTADPELSRNWKRLQVVSVPTDPAFPDPRVTRPPTPSPSPRPTPTPPPFVPFTPPPQPFAPATDPASPLLPVPGRSVPPARTDTPSNRIATSPPVQYSE